MQRSIKAGTAKIMLFMLTDILKESTELLVLGEGANELIEMAFGVTPVDNSVILPGVVSRKKQLMPMLLNAVHRMNEE